MFGQYFQSGIYVEIVSTDPNARIVVTVLAVARDCFSPAYMHPHEVLQYYWDCWRGPESPFLGDWDSGSSGTSWSDSGGGNDTPWYADNYYPIIDEGGGGDGEGGINVYRKIDSENSDHLIQEDSEINN